MIETRLLEYFLVLSHQKNISQAAKSLYISQSTLSKQMMELEEKLGKQLFIRGKRKITLTQEGTFLQKRTQEILDLIKTTELSLSGEEKELAGQISIGCGETIVMERTLPEGEVVMSVCTPDLGLTEKTYTTAQESQPIEKEVRLAGSWALAAEVPGVALAAEADATLLKVTCRHGQPVEFRLKKK